MVKDAPSFGKIAAMVLFALSCFGLLLFLWLAFGGPVPLKPKGYRFHTSFAEAGQLALEADVRISRRAGRQGQDDHAGQADRAARTSRSSCGRATRRCRRTRKAILRQKTLLGETYVELTPGRHRREADPRGRRAARLAGVGHGRARRDPARVRPQDARGVPGLDADAGAGDRAAAGRTSTTRSATSAPFAEDTATIVDILNRQEGAVSRLVANTGIVFRRLTERDGQLRSLIENSNTVFATTAARDSELQAAFRALPTFEDESRKTFDRLTSSPTRPIRWSRSCGRRRASCRRRSRTSRTSRPT